MVLGTCNFGFAYNGPQLEKKESFKILETFQKLGGGIIDTAVNYREAHSIINEFVKVNGQDNLNIQTKVYEVDELDEYVESLDHCEIYSILYRNHMDKDVIYHLKIEKKHDWIEKYGQSIYYPHELRQEANIIQIPANKLFEPYYSTMSLYADIQIRSIYNLGIKYNNPDYLMHFIELKRQFPKIDYVIGVDNVQQLKENYEVFGNNTSADK